MGHETTITNGYAISVNGGSSSTLTYDLNGNMTSDGTNSYLWDAENRMIKITYPGTNNFSSFVYDGHGRNVSIVETTAGSVTSTKQFVWCGNDRSEERDAGGTLTIKFFASGQMNSLTKYFYTRDHLGGVREITDNIGVIQGQYVFDPYGRVTKIVEIVASAFGYAGYYLHARSGLDLTLFREYNASIACWLSRDPVFEGSGFYSYVSNSPIKATDPLGLDSWIGQNCLGYFCGLPNAQQPGNGQSINDILNQNGWHCRLLPTCRCTCPPGQKKGYGFALWGDPPPMYGPTSPWSTPWQSSPGFNDFHFVIQQPDGTVIGYPGYDPLGLSKPKTYPSPDDAEWPYNSIYTLCCCHK